MAPHGKELSEDLKKRSVALHKDGVGYKKIAKTLKLSCSTVAKTIQRFNRTGSTQNRPRHGRPKKLSARTQLHIHANIYCDIMKQRMIPSLRRLGCRAVFKHDNDPKHTSKMTTALLKKLRIKVICGASSNERWRSTRSLTSTSSVMSSWRSRRGLQWQPVKLWWTPCPRGLSQCWKIMMTTQNIDIVGPIWTFSLRGVLSFVASGIDINGYVLSYFEGTASLHCYTSCTLTTLHCSKV